MPAESHSESFFTNDGPSDIYSLGIILRELRLGFFSQSVIKRCLAPKTTRISHVADVRKAPVGGSNHTGTAERDIVY